MGRRSSRRRRVVLLVVVVVVVEVLLRLEEEEEEIERRVTLDVGTPAAEATAAMRPACMTGVNSARVRLCSVMTTWMRLVKRHA
jgi:hypothetical protein